MRWWNGSTGFGAVVLNGTMMQSWFERRGLGEITTTGRRLIISGTLKLVLKSQINTMPGWGWKVSAIRPMRLAPDEISIQETVFLVRSHGATIHS